MAVEHRPQGKQVIAEALQGSLAPAAHLEASNAPGEGTVGVGTHLERGGKLGQLDGLLLAQLVSARSGCRRPGRQASPVALTGRGKGVGPQPDASGLEEMHDADQLAQLVHRALGALRALALLAEGQELRLPGSAASSAPRVSASSMARALLSRSWSSASSVQPSQSEARKTQSIRAARSLGSPSTGSPRASR